MKHEIDWCADIGMFTINRPIPVSCVHASEWCKLGSGGNCYNHKLYRLYPAMRGKDERNETAWQTLTGAAVGEALGRKKLQTKRVRLMARGEAFATALDILRVDEIVSANPGVEWWIPTRAWRDLELRDAIACSVSLRPNAHVLASTDPTTTDAEWAELESAGWSTMFAGEDQRTHTPTGSRMFPCPKTHQGLKGHCATCKAGCFGKSIDRRVDVHLNQH